ncbi:ubiquinone biosynthesis accessory factor UbiJ [Halopseudomonas formosensis]|jgi:ubiquinone biosynthesis protein UbiJ|uniref:Ubiquinone biosynthesis accessory factor UbiJ n=1 Tax=Halopseudomonas formosensis TaxID=1002526 RepID=A0A1I6C0P1_9GAMM|nr:SCP2 sterol-binding domain-containing protein [Halopseudomonas formosensis]MDX9687991.1 SCP2 sterol-binding domain-containing protein [Halopseudomonas formosensis]MDY3198477.1 SCP2 sterol-binding domain-containing protein [Pseudomonadaceae bacterium]SFQ86756.1 ubiquinone biosynthesis protein UbiJ [Halopseudomonas formosensis]
MPSRLLLAGVERSLQLAIQQDPLTAQRLAALQGRVILIRSRQPSLSVYLLPGADGLRLSSEHHAEVDCSLSAPASLLARLALSSDRQQLLQAPELELSGDTQVLVQLQNIFADLRIDGEAALARWLGPVAAHAIGRAARQGRNWLGTSQASLEQAVADYLTEEGRQLVGRAEADVAAAQIHELRLQLDRLDARVQRLSHPDTGSDA